MDRFLSRKCDSLGRLLVFAVVLLGACGDSAPTDPPVGQPGAAAFDAEVPVAWLRLTYDLTRDEGFLPPTAARAYAYAGVALWEAVAPGVTGGRSLAGQLNGLPPITPPGGDVHWPTVANEALATLVPHFYPAPASQAAIQELADEFRLRFRGQTTDAIHARSIARGQHVGGAILEWSASDGYDTLHDCAFTPAAGPGAWTPTPPGFRAAVEPCWGQLRPFVLDDPGVCDPGPPPAYSEDPASEFYQQALEVYETVNNVTEEQRTIALYWADLDSETGTPAGHSLSMAAHILETENASLDFAAETLARVGIGESDAFINCWATKYRYNLLRPVSYIRDVIDPDWVPIIETPPFPAYTSGHSNDAGASSTILTALFGDGFAFTDHTHESRGMAPRSFDSFFDAAQESAFSRLYGGIHYRFDIEPGLAQGSCVGQIVNALVFRTR